MYAAAGGGGGGDPFGLGTVTVTPDPNLMSADPAAMQAVAQEFSSAAKEMYQIFQTTSTGSGVLLESWHGKAAQSYWSTAQQQNINAEAAADGLMGASGALTSLASAITAAQDKARQAMALASNTNSSITSLNNAYDQSSASAVASLPANANPEEAVAAAQPTANQNLQAEALMGDAQQAQTLMNEANQEAQQAWQKASADFDAVTSQSPTVQLALLGARVHAFSQTVDQAGLEAIAMMMAGSLSGDGPGGDDDDDDDDLDFDDPAIAKLIDEEGFEDGEDLDVDGLKLNEDIAVDGNSQIGVEIEEAEQAALGDPNTGTEIGNPGSPLSASEYPYLEPPYEESYGATSGMAPASDPVTVSDAPPGWPELPAKQAATFQGPVEPTAAEGGVTYYRVVGDGSYPGGSFWSTTPPTDMSRSDLAIHGDWNSMTGVVEFTPAAGESIPAWHGATAPQPVTMPDGTPGYYPGGADQIWVPQNAFNNNNGTFTIHPAGGS
jgi:uncharacterized protein YukE